MTIRCCSSSVQTNTMYSFFIKSATHKIIHRHCKMFTTIKHILLNILRLLSSRMLSCSRSWLQNKCESERHQNQTVTRCLKLVYTWKLIKTDQKGQYESNYMETSSKLVSKWTPTNICNADKSVYCDVKSRQSVSWVTLNGHLHIIRYLCGSSAYCQHCYFRSYWQCDFCFDLFFSFSFSFSFPVIF